MFYIPDTIQGYIEGTSLNNSMGIGFKVISKNKMELGPLSILSGGEYKWGLALIDHIVNNELVYYSLSKNQLRLMDTLQTDLIVFQKLFKPIDKPTELPIAGLWEATDILIDGALKAIPRPLPEEGNSFDNIVFQIPDTQQRALHFHTFYGFYSISFDLDNEQKIKLSTDLEGGHTLTLKRDQWGDSLFEAIGQIAQYELTNNNLIFLDSLGNQLVVFRSLE